MKKNQLSKLKTYQYTQKNLFPTDKNRVKIEGFSLDTVNYLTASNKKNVLTEKKKIKAVRMLAEDITDIFLAKDLDDNAPCIVIITEAGSQKKDGHIFKGNHLYFSTNIYSHQVVSSFIYALVLKKNKMVTKAIRSLEEDYENTWGHKEEGIVYFDTNTHERVADILANVEDFVKKNITEKTYLGTMDDFREIIKDFDFTANVTNIVKPMFNANEYKLCDTSIECGLRNIPLTEDKKKSKKDAAIDLKLKPLFTEEEAKNFSPHLKPLLENAVNLYNMNKEFLTKEDKELLYQLSIGDVRSVALLGPAGVGKTTLATMYAGALNQPLVLVGGSQGIEESSLFGYERLEDPEKNGNTRMIWHDGPITTAIREGAMLLFDEENAAEPGVIMKLNSVLDNSKIITLDNGESVPVHKNFRYLAAMNIGAGYDGTNKMNNSHFDRMDEIFKIKQKSSTEMAKIVMKQVDYKNKKHVVKMCDIQLKIAALIAKEGDTSEQITSIRRVIQWLKKAKVTGEFIKSSCTTILSHLCIYDDAIEEFTLSELASKNGNSIAPFALELITSAFENTYYGDEEEVDYE